MKQIKVDCCGNCPYQEDEQCTHPEMYDNKIGGLELEHFPSWCPLEDVKED